jgi:hypothetical protein
MRSLLVAVGFAALMPGCTTYKDDLSRSERAFEDNQQERALAILRMLEPDTRHLDSTDRARYAYLRGMTDYRIGYKADARHWLAVAKAMDEESPGILAPDWRTRLDESLAQLDAVVWVNGMESVSNAKARASSHAKHPEKKVEEPAEDEEKEQEQPKPVPKKKKPIDEEDE